MDAGRHAPAILLGVGIVLVGGFALQSYRVIDQELSQAALSRRASVAYLAASVATEKFDRLIDVGVALATRVRFRELVEAGEWDKAMNILRQVPADFPFVDRIILSDAEGITRGELPVLGTVGQNFAHRTWYGEVMRTRQAYISELYRRTAKPQINIFVAAIPIRNRADGVSGILVMQVRSDRFFEWTNAIETGPGGIVYVVDRNGRLAASSQFDAQAELQNLSSLPAVRNALGGKRGVGIELNPLVNDEHVVAYEPLAKHGWGVVLSQPAAVAFEARDRQLAGVLAVSAVLLFVLSTLAVLGSRLLRQRRQAETDRRDNAELERRVAERTAALEASNRELEGFTYSISHDLRAPLRAIDGFSQLLEQSCGARLDAEERRKLQIIRSNGRRMSRLVDDLLAFSRINRKSVAPETVDMGVLAREVFDELSGAANAGSVEFVAAAMPAALCNRALIRLVWFNLLQNALKFTSTRSAARIEIGGRKEGADCIYYVKDNGAGFDMRYYDKLFGVFQRLHGEEEFPGTGVGLAIVQRVIERHGGRVWAESRVEEGATFWFSLPVRPLQTAGKPG